MKFRIIEYNSHSRYMAVVDDMIQPHYTHFLGINGGYTPRCNYMTGDKFRKMTMKDYFEFNYGILDNPITSKHKYNIRKIIKEMNGEIKLIK